MPYGSITLDGNLSDWTASQELDNSLTTVAGYQLYGAYLPDSSNNPYYVFAINAATANVTIGAGTTIYLNTDNNTATGYVLGGGIGAEYKILFDSTGTPYLWSYNSTTTLWTQVGTTPLAYAYTPTTHKAVELAVPVASLAGAPKIITANVVINGTINVPQYYSLADEIKAPVTVAGIKLDGAIADWPSAPLAQIPANTVAGYNVYGQLVTDATLGKTYVIGIISTSTADPVIGANTYIYLNTDQNNSTGYSPFAGANAGAEYVIQFKLDANGYLQPYLYSATSTAISTTALNGGNPLNWSPSADGKSIEVAIPQSLLTPTGGTAPNSINFDVLLNNSAGLPTSLGAAPEYTITDPSTIQTVSHTTKKVAIIYSQESAANYFKGATDPTGKLIPQAALTSAYDDLFMTAQHQVEAAGVPYDIITADTLATMTAAQLAQYSVLVIPSMNNVQNAAQAQQITNVLSQLEYNYHVGIITSGDFMTADANNALLPQPYLAMQTLLGATYNAAGTGTYSLSVDPSATSNPIMAGYAAGALIGGASGQFAGTTAGYYTNTGYSSYKGLAATPTTTLADINLTTSAGAATTSSLPGVIQTTTGGVNTLFATTGLIGDSNLLQHVVQNAVFGTTPSLAFDTTRFTGMVDSRTDLDQSQFAADIKPTGGGPGIYDEMIPIIQQWAQQYDFVGSFYTNVGLGAAGTDNAGNNLTLMAPYLKQLLALGDEIGSHSTDHLINPPAVDANGNPVPTTVVNGETVSTWNENTNYLYTTAPANGSAPNWTYAYEFGNSNTLINQALGITVAGAAVPGANDYAPDSLNILPYYPSNATTGVTGYVNGGWTGAGSGSPNAFGYIDPTNTNSIYIAPNITFDFSEVQYQAKTATQTLADWETLFNQMSANSQQPIIVWPWHDYGVTDWNTTTDTPNAGLYQTSMFTSFIAYAYNAGYEFVTSEDLAARIAAEQRAVISETNPTANTINVTVTPGVATDDLGTMALNVVNGGTNVIQNAGSWYAYDTNSVFMAKAGVSNVTVTLGATQDDVTHIDYLPMRADLQTVTGNGSNLSFSFTGDGAADKVDIHVKTPGTNIISVQGAPASATLTGSDLVLNFNDSALTTPSTLSQAASILHNVVVSDQATAVGTTGNDYIFGGSGNDTIAASGGHDVIDGGGGTNTMLFHGALANYSIDIGTGGVITVIDNRAGSPDGTDTLTNFAFLQFSDVTLSTTAPIPPTPPVIFAPTYTGTAASGHWNLSGRANEGTTISLYDRSLISATNPTGLITTFTDTAADGSWSYAALASNAADSRNVAHDFYGTSSSGSQTATSGDYWVGTAGNNTFTFASEPALGLGGVWGNGGTDTIAFTTGVTLTDADFANVHLGGLTIPGGVTANDTAMTLSLTGTNTVTLGANALAAKVNTVIVGSGGGSITDANAGTLTVNASALAAASTLTLSTGAGTGGFTVTGLAGILNASAAKGALSVTTAATSAVSITTGAGANTINATALTSAGTLTLAGSGTTTVTGLSGSVNASAVTGALTVRTVAASASVATGTGANTVNATAMTAGQTLTVTGNKAATIRITGNLAASADTGPLTVVASGTAPETIVTGSGADTITSGGAGDTITGGGGADTFVYTDGTNSLYSSYDTITDFSAADRFKIGSTVAASDFYKLGSAGTGNLSNDIAALLAPSTYQYWSAALVTLTGSSDAGSYVVVNNTGAATFDPANDSVIKLTTGASSVSASSFIA